jgi:hypothetical protein
MSFTPAGVFSEDSAMVLEGGGGRGGSMMATSNTEGLVNDGE